MGPNWRTESTGELSHEIWASLTRACSEPGNPWRLPALATVSDTAPQVRTVVLREASASTRQLVAWTDSRAHKVEELRNNPVAQWLFHDPGKGLPLRVITRVQVHYNDKVARAAWATVPDANRANYQGTEAPGGILKISVSSGEPMTTPPSGSLPHFAVLIATVNDFDWLSINPAGHRRARFCCVNGRWAGTWVAP